MKVIIFLYACCLVLSVAFLVRFIASKEHHNVNIYLMLFSVAISNGGYLVLAMADTTSEAILANKLSYFGGVFTPMLVFVVVCDICHIRLSNTVIALMHVVQLLLFSLVCSIGYSEIYYKSAVLAKNSLGISTLEKVYGPTHFLYPITMYGYLLACLVMAIISLFRSHVVSYKNLNVFIISLLIAVTGYVLERALHLELEIVPFVNTIVITAIAGLSYRMNRYHINDNIQKVHEDTNEDAYIAFNTKLGYLGCNRTARELFPEMADYKLDRAIPYSENLITSRILPMILEYKEDKTKNYKRFESGTLTYDCRINPITREGKTLVGYLVELKDVTEQIRILEMTQNYNRNLESEVLGKTQRIREIQDRTILGMAQMVESRDLSTGGHIKRTSSVVNVFARELLKSNLGLSQQFLSYVEKSAPMHDLGKIAVDDEILRKPGRFTDEEYAKMKQHSSEGARVVREILTGVEDEEFMQIAVNVAHFHHEKMDGTGYPKGLKGEEIPMEARIMALADVFDALVSKRCYKEAFTYDKAFSIIEESAGSHFDPDLAKVFLKCRPRLEALYQSFE